jgi:5'-nucleotidase
MTKKPVILVTNDDGIFAPGIRELIKIMRELGKVIVIAPDKPQSGTGHAITLNIPLRIECISKEEDFEEYSCNGTPADCVKLGFKVLIKGRPDLLVAGINHGSNASVNIIYSGTMAAVLEGSMAGVPSIGFSLNNYSHDAFLGHCQSYVKKIVVDVLQNGLPLGVCLNVNIPDVSSGMIKGLKVCRQAGGTWQEDFDERTDPGGKSYFWLKGLFIKIGNGEDTDVWALENNFISVVPVQFDLTAPDSIHALKSRITYA